MLERTLLIEQIIDAWQKLQHNAPLVQCITNQVASNYAANVLLACGASPAMIDNPFEAKSFTQISAALSINLGTPTEAQMQAMQISAETAQQHQKPWVLDPVGYSPILKWRSDMTDILLQYHPTVIRGNASEISTLAGNQSSSKGVDSTISSDAVYAQAQNLLQHCDCVAISGESDYVLTQGSKQVIKINGGSALQPKVTATGCALGALIAAYCSVTTPQIACSAAHVHFAIAGQLAAARAPQIGQFAVAFMDELFSLNAEKIAEFADIELLD